jgi:O-antigen/teichoic acid export membrane protein
VLLALRGATGAAAVSYGVGLAVLPFVLRRLGTPVYGAWVSISSLLVIGVLADAGVRTEIVRRVAAAHGADDRVALTRAVHEGVTLLVGVGGAFALLGSFGAPALRAFAFPHGVPGYSPAAVEWLIRGTLALLSLTLVSNGYFGVLKGVQRPDVETVSQMAAVPAGAVVTVLAVVAGWGLAALLLGAFVQLMVGSVWQWVRLERVVPGLRPRLVRMGTRATGAYLGLSGLVLLCQISDVVDSQWDKLVLSRFVGSTAVTSFQVGTSLVIQGKALVAVPLLPLLAAMSELRGRDDQRMERFFAVLSGAGMAVGAVVLGGIFVFSPAFIRLWLGPDVAAAGGAARLFAVAAGLSVLVLPLACRALGEGWHRLVAIAAVVNMVVNGALSLALTLWIGFNGPLYGSIAGNLAGTLAFLLMMRRRLGGKWRRPPMGAVVVGVLAAAVAVGLGLDRLASWPSLAVAGAAWTLGVGSVGCAVEHLPVTDLLRRRVSP